MVKMCCWAHDATRSLKVKKTPDFRWGRLVDDSSKRQWLPSRSPAEIVENMAGASRFAAVSFMLCVFNL